jgi:hypothetical protein
MKFNIDDVIQEISYLTETGIIDLSDEKHILLLKEVLASNGLSQEFINEYTQNAYVSWSKLMETENSEVSVQAKKLGLKHVGYGYYADKGGNVTYKSDKGKLIKLSGKESKTRTAMHQQKKSSGAKSKEDALKKTLGKEKPQKPTQNIFTKTSTILKDVERANKKVKEIAVSLKSVPFKSASDKKVVLSVLDGVRKGEFEPLKKYANIVNQYIRVGGNPEDAKIYIATKVPNNFNQGFRHKVESIGKELRGLLTKFGMKSAETTTTGGKASVVKSKMFSAGKMFSEKNEVGPIGVKKTETSLSMGEHTVYKLTEPQFQTLVETSLIEIYKKRGSENPQRDAQFTMRAVRKHNELLNRLSETLNENVLFIQPVPGLEPTTPENRKKIVDATLDKLLNTTKTIFGKNPSNDIQEIMLGISALKASNNFETDSLKILTKIANSQEFTKGAADIAEIFTYTRRLNSDQIAYLPAQSNFPLADIISMSPLKLTAGSTAEEIVSAVQSIFVSFDYRSVKKGEGGASATNNKVNLSIFKSKDTRRQLSRLLDTTKSIWDEKSPDVAFGVVKSIGEEVGVDIDSILKDPNTNNTINTLIGRYKNTIHNKDVFKKQLIVHNVCGKLIEQIYNKDIDIQLFSNERYKESKREMSLSITDGIHSISELQFILDIGKFNPESGKPETAYATRFHPKEVE